MSSRHRLFHPPPAAGLWLMFVIALLITTALAERLDNGLDIETTKHGDCAHKAQKGDVIAMHYKGTLDNGDVFDSNGDKDRPLEFKLGTGHVIQGWDLGLLGICLGEERKLIIPPKLAYGSRGVGTTIPPDATLTFETKLVRVNDVSTDQPSGVKDKPSPEANTKPETEGDIATADETDKEDDTKAESTKQPGAENGECRLLGPFALVVQAGLGLLALFSLVWKRWRERPRRPVKVWFFDVSKQVVGSALLHLLNVLMSMISSNDYELANKAKHIQDDTGTEPNPCSFYLINIAVDTTIGIPILVIFLKVLHRGAALTPLARPPESIKSGNYGQPPQAAWWVKQSAIYFVGLLLMKLCVLAIFGILPWIALVGNWALRWTEGSEALQIIFVMFVFPLIMNALQYYIIDSFIKDGSGGEGERRPAEGYDENDESREPLHRASEYEERLSPRASDEAAQVKQVQAPTVRPKNDNDLDRDLGREVGDADNPRKRTDR